MLPCRREQPDVPDSDNLNDFHNVFQQFSAPHYVGPVYGFINAKPASFMSGFAFLQRGSLQNIPGLFPAETVQVE